MQAGSLDSTKVLRILNQSGTRANLVEKRPAATAGLKVKCFLPGSKSELANSRLSLSSTSLAWFSRLLKLSSRISEVDRW